jgi:hypothetical protein
VNVKAEQPGKIYVVEVRNKRQEAGNYAGVIELTTTSKKRPRLIMRVFGELSLPSAGKPLTSGKGALMENIDYF